MKKVNWLLLILNLGISLGVGALSAFLTRGSMEQYMQEYKPPLAPPGWLFPIVWTILFILMGIAAYLVSVSVSAEKREALLLYGIQLVVNFFWSIIFFNLDAYTLAFFWLLLLWYLIYMTIKKFHDIDPRAGKLLLPYIIWVTFAGYLNFMIAFQNLIG